MSFSLYSILFFFNDPPTTEIYTLSLHDALPISNSRCTPRVLGEAATAFWKCKTVVDRKSTRLNSSHTVISYAVFCLKKKKRQNITRRHVRTENRQSRHATAWPQHTLATHGWPQD